MPIPAIVVPRSHLLPNDSETAPASPVSSISPGLGSLDTEITPRAPYLSQGAPTPQQCSYGARPYGTLCPIPRKRVSSTQRIHWCPTL